MSFLDAFLDWKTTSVDVYRTTGGVLNSATGKTTGSESKINTTPHLVIFWQGRQAERVVAEKIRSEVDAVAVFDPGTDVIARDKLDINGDRYNVIAPPDDVAFQGEALIAALKRIN